MTDRFETRWHGIGACGSFALDLVNTLDWRLRAQPVELLHSASDLLRWAWTAGVVEIGQARALRHWAETHPRKAVQALAGVVELREAIASVLTSKVRAEELPSPALAVLEKAHHAAVRVRSLHADGSAAAWAWREAAPRIERIAHAAALEAVRLLTTPEGQRIRQCADAECGWFFLDTSRNRSRRWCSMEGCGNRNKVRSFYRRTRPRGSRDG